MRWSQVFIPTLRDDPAGAEAISHKLLIRGGFIRQLMSGSYSLLPAGFRVHSKIRRIIKEEIDAIGGQEFLMPVLHPAEVWQRSGRWEVMGDELFRLKDRRGIDHALGMTHEEIFALIATELRSYKQLPQLWYHFQTKLRDEPRPKSGLLRVREFVMKDSYSLDLDAEGQAKQFDAHHVAYTRIFERMGLDTVAVEASSGAMGGTNSVEFMVESSAGEDLVAYSPDCGYSANVERARSRIPAVANGDPLDAVEKFPTPGVRTIEALADFDAGASAENQIKTLVYIADGEPVLVLMRGDHPLQEQKLSDHLGVSEVRPAHEDEIFELLGAHAGSLGAVGVETVKVIADPQLRGRVAMTTGANEDGFHYRGVDIGRDIAVSEWVDLREVKAGEGCPNCDGVLDVYKAIEVGHIFKLGTKYSEAFGATVLDENGKTRPIIMGSYGIGLGRAVAAVAEVHNDDKGLAWPVAVAPWEVVVTLVKTDEATLAAGERIYSELQFAGIDVLLDDRNERPGVKFNDAELIGIPFRVTLGPRGLAEGVAEFVARADGKAFEVALDAVVGHVKGLVEAAR
ncbi:MAG: proline--tRNA ligase [Acidimicrobiia bacterium]|nr:proline--tRNA ligase [Acidimicrobiia bacterium]